MNPTLDVNPKNHSHLEKKLVLLQTVFIHSGHALGSASNLVKTSNLPVSNVRQEISYPPVSPKDTVKNWRFLKQNFQILSEFPHSEFNINFPTVNFLRTMSTLIQERHNKAEIFTVVTVAWKTQKVDIYKWIIGSGLVEFFRK